MSGEINEISHSIGRIEAKLDALTFTVNDTIKTHSHDLDELKEEMNRRKGAWATLCLVASFSGAVALKVLEMIFK